MVSFIQYRGRRAVLGDLMDISSRKRVERVKDSLYKIGEAANSTQSLEEPFGSIHEIIKDLMPARNFYIALYDPELEILGFPYLTDEHTEEPLPRKIGKGVTEYILSTREALLALRDVLDESPRKGEVGLLGKGPVDWLGVPLKTQEGITGVVAAQSYTEGVRFGEEEKNILMFVSGQIALAIEPKQKEEELREGGAAPRHYLVRVSPRDGHG